MRYCVTITQRRSIILEAKTHEEAIEFADGIENTDPRWDVDTIESDVEELDTREG